ncbi:MAG: CAP domain-containing protein [Caldilineaceae bacterium]
MRSSHRLFTAGGGLGICDDMLGAGCLVRQNWPQSCTQTSIASRCRLVKRPCVLGCITDSGQTSRKPSCETPSTAVPVRASGKSAPIEDRRMRTRLGPLSDRQPTPARGPFGKTAGCLLAFRPMMTQPSKPHRLTRRTILLPLLALLLPGVHATPRPAQRRCRTQHSKSSPWSTRHSPTTVSHRWRSTHCWWRGSIHVDDMVANHLYSHTGSDGGSVRPRRIGYAGGSDVSENWVASSGPEGAMAWWMNSYVHRGNILNSKWNEIGVGTKRDPNNRMQIFVLVFGGGRTAPTPTPVESAVYTPLEVPPGGLRYTVQSGDTLSTIATLRRQLADPGQCQQSRRIQRLADRTDALSPGQRRGRLLPWASAAPPTPLRPSTWSRAATR